MKLVALICLLGLGLAQSPLVSYTLILEGIVEGFIGVEAPNLANCFFDLDQAAIKILDSLKILSDLHNEAKWIQTVDDLLNAVNSISDAVQTCPNNEDFKQIVKDKLKYIQQATEDPFKFIEMLMQNFEANLNEMQREIKVALAEYDAGHWYQYGYFTGQFLYRLFLGWIPSSP